MSSLHPPDAAHHGDHARRILGEEPRERRSILIRGGATRRGENLHRVRVFLNELYGGSPSTDRNFFVAGLDFDGDHHPEAAANLYSAGTASLTFTTTPDHVWM